MEQNILREANITKTYLSYIDNKGLKKKFPVKLKFMDTKVCYFATPLPISFEKPKSKTPVTVVAYTPDGVYTTNLNIIDTHVSVNDVMFEVNIPKVWNYKQLRSSSRKLVELPFSIKFNDGFEISGNSYDLSTGGFSFFYSNSFSSIYKTISGILTIEFPKNMIINFPDAKLVVESKYAREQQKVEDVYSEGVLYAFKFIGLKEEQLDILKRYLLSLD